MKHSESPRAFYNTVSLYVFPVIDGADLFMSWTEEMVFSTNRARIRLGGESVAQNIIVRYIVLYSRNRANGWVFFNMHTIVPLSSTDTCPSTLVVSNFFFLCSLEPQLLQFLNRAFQNGLKIQHWTWLVRLSIIYTNLNGCMHAREKIE